MASATLRRPIACSSVAAASRPSLVLGDSSELPMTTISRPGVWGSDVTGDATGPTSVILPPGTAGLNSCCSWPWLPLRSSSRLVVVSRGNHHAGNGGRGLRHPRPGETPSLPSGVARKQQGPYRRPAGGAREVQPAGRQTKYTAAPAHPCQRESTKEPAADQECGAGPTESSPYYKRRQKNGSFPVS